MPQLFNIFRIIRILILRIIVSFKPSIRLPQTAIIIAPHPDDEVFGCCGLMKRMIAEGKQVELIIMTGGGKSHFGCCVIDEDLLIQNRRQLTRNAALLYGLGEEHIHFLNYPDGGVLFSDNETKVLEGVLERHANEKAAVFSPYSKGEGWSDHIHASNIAKELCANICPNISQYEYCVWFWYYHCWNTDWKNAVKLKLSKLESSTKKRAIETYIVPKAPCGNPWSGVLPPVLIWANKWTDELYFKVK